MNNLITRDSILAMDAKPEIEKIFVPAWKANVFIRVLDAATMDAFQMSMYSDNGVKAEKLRNFRARLASLCLCDETGNALFTEKDALELGKKSTKAMDVIIKACQKLNGITQENKDELLKNSETTQGDVGNLS